MTPKEQRRVLEELARRKERLERIDFDTLLFPGPQRDFVMDPSKRKVAVCSRRAGKTFGILIYALKVLHQYSYCQVPYITLTRQQGKRNIWLALQKMDKQLKLGGDFNNNELKYKLPNGSELFICGANDETEIQRLRGANYPLAMVDEAQSFRPFIRSLIRDILEPAASDYEGTIIMTGTPGPACAGFFYEASNNLLEVVIDGEKFTPWSIHHWTVVDNPFHPYDETKVDRIRKENGWAIDNPTFLREWRGLWVKDDSRRVYKCSEANHSFDKPLSSLTYVLGMDLGYEDSTAFVILGYDESVGQTWVIESYKREHLIPSAVAAHVERLRERFDFTHIVADSGGFGKGYVEEMKQRYSIPVEAAEKQHKYAYIELLNGDFQAHAIHIIRSRNQELIDELGTLQYEENEDGTADRTKIDDRFPDHLCDALLYGWRACRQYYYDPIRENPPKSSPEWWKNLEEEMEEAAVRELEAQNSLDGSRDDEASFPDEPLTIGDQYEDLSGEGPLW